MDRGAWQTKVHGVTKELGTTEILNNMKKQFGPGLALRPSLVAQMVKNLPTMQKTWVQSLDREDSLEKSLELEMALRYSCLGNPKDRVAWWATVHGIAKSRT